MTLRKPLMLAAAAVTIGMAGTGLAVNAASAETGEGTLADKIAQKFNLNKDEVKAVFEEHHKVKKAEHKANMEQKLNAAVAEGKLTEDQKSKILAKLEELKANPPDKSALENMSKEERRAQMQQRHDELKKWAADNNIPEEFLPIRLHIKAGPGGGEGLVVREIQ